MKVLSRGDGVRAGRYAVRARFDRSVLLLGADDRALFVVDPSIGAGPLNLVVKAPGAFVAGETLAVPRRRAGSRYDSALPRLDAAARERLRRALETFLPRHAPPESLASLFSPAGKIPRLQQARDLLFRKALAQIAAGRPAAGIRMIRGCGAGLTPAGDDFLCGWMLACRLQRQSAKARRILKPARGKNPVSNAFLEIAARGRVNVAVKKLLPAPTAARVRAVCAFGHSSGADLLCGLLFGLGHSELRIQNPE